MARKLTQQELRNQSGEIMRALDRGEEFTLIRNGKPVGELRPVERRHFSAREDVVKAFADVPEIDFERFRADIDAYIDPTPRYWSEP